MNNQLYMKPECECMALMGSEICDMVQASKITGNSDGGEINIGDGGDNGDDVPLPSAKEFASLWYEEEEEEDDY